MTEDETEQAALARYQFRRTLDEVRGAKGRGTELITVYVPPGRAISDVVGYLRGEHSQSANIKSKSTMKNVQGAIESILSRLRAYRHPPPNGLAIFVGHKAIGGDKTRMVAFVIEPIEPVPTFYYRCDSSFFLEPLEGMLSEKEIFGLVVVDRAEATIGFLKGTLIESVRTLPSLVPSKHGRGGQSQRRFERLIEESAHNFFKKVGESMTEIFLPVEGLRGIIVGGPGATKDYFVNGEYLHHELVTKVVDTFDTGYTDDQGLRELVEAARERLGQLALNRERDLMGRFTREVARHSGSLATYGEPQLRSALAMGAVDTVLLSEGLRKERVLLDCTACDFEDRITVGRGDETGRCPRCGEDQPLGEDRRDVVDDLTEVAKGTAARVALITGESDEGSMFLRAFGGMGALLRYAPGGV